MRLRAAEDEVKPTGTFTSIRGWGPDGAVGRGFGGTIPYCLVRKTVLLDGQTLFLEMAGMLSYP